MAIVFVGFLVIHKSNDGTAHVPNTRQWHRPEKQPMNKAGGTVGDWRGEEEVWVIGAENGKSE